MKPFLFFLCTHFIVLTSRAELPPNNGDSPEATLSLGTVTQAVLANNPSIKAARAKWDGARQRVPQVAAWDDLKISANTRLARFADIAPNGFTDQIFSVEQMIPVSGRNRSRERIAVAVALSAMEELRREEIETITKARTAYYRLLNTYGQIELNRKNLVSLKQIAEISRSRYGVGTEIAANVLLAETEANKVMEVQSDLDRKLSDAESELNVLMNRDAFTPLGKPVPVTIEAPDFSLPELRAKTLANRPEVRMARATVEAVKARLQLAQRDWIPDPAITVSAQRYNGAAQSVSEVDAGVSITVPWFNHKKYIAESREAANNLTAAEHDLDRVEKEAVRMLRDQLQKIGTAHHHVELFSEKIVPKAKEASEAVQFSYESGKASFLDWISAQRSAREIEAMELDHLTDYQIAVAELESVVGTELRPHAPTVTKTNKRDK